MLFVILERIVMVFGALLVVGSVMAPFVAILFAMFRGEWW